MCRRNPRVTRTTPLCPGTALLRSDAGRQPGERGLEGDGTRYETFTEVADDVASRPGEDVTLSVARDGEVLEVPAEIGVVPSDRSRGQLGVRRDLVTTTVGPVRAVGASSGDFWVQTTATLGFTGPFSPTDFFEDVVPLRDAKSTAAPPEPSPGSRRRHPATAPPT